MKSVIPTLVFIIVYVLFVTFGGQLMRNRQAFDLRKLMFIYNCFQVIFYTYITLEVQKYKINFQNKIKFLCIDNFHMGQRRI